METINLPHSFDIFPKCLANKIILITGATQGIGRTLAIESARYGATTVLLGKNVKKLETVYDEIMSNGGPEPAIHPVNLLNLTPDDAFSLSQNIEQMFGRLDAVVHNASMVGQICPTELLPADKWLSAIHLNLNIPFLLTQAFIPLLKKAEQSSILFTTANEATMPKAYWSAFAASKAGIVALAGALFEELKENTNIRVNCINPGIVRTAMRVNAYPGIDPTLFAAPEAIIDSYIYLLNTPSHNINGKCVKAVVKEKMDASAVAEEAMADKSLAPMTNNMD